jgi:hypothetical protein
MRVVIFLKNMKKQLNILYKDKSRKPFLQILIEVIHTAIKLKGIPSHYFSYFLYRRGESNYLDYLGKNEILKIHQSIHDKNTMQILDNKLFFQKYFEKTEIKIPNLLAHNFGNMFFLKNYKIQIDNIEEFFEILYNLLKHSNSDSIFIKPIIGAFGENVHKITLNNITNMELGKREELFKEILSGNFIFQETVTQHPDINKIYSQSLNTVRIDTFINDDRESEILSAAMRMGTDGSYIDNMSGGGFFIGINLETGCLKKNGLTYFKYGAKMYARHPNSGIPFENYKIPYFDEVKEMAKTAAYLLQDKLVGWDIGISEKGPVLIEGNAYYGMACSQMSYGGYREHPFFKKVIDVVKEK